MNNPPNFPANRGADLGAELANDPTLTPEQRELWEAMRKELATAKAKARDLEKHIKSLEQTTAEEQTAVLTRPEFNREVARMLALDERYGGSSSVLYFNFENMEAVAERYGKSVANAAVREITVALMRHVRNSDIVGRLGGDEFGVLLIRCGNMDAWKKGKELAEHLTTALTEVHGCSLMPNISFGAYTFRSDEDVASGLKQAAQAVTKAANR